MKHSERGAANILVLPFIILLVLFIGAAGFGGWSYLQAQQWKDGAQPKITAAVAAAQQQAESAAAQKYADELKQPLSTYNGPSSYGSIVLRYPKTWSGYVSDNGDSGNPIDGYFYPGVVPSINDSTKVFALRLQVVAQSYSSVLADLQSRQKSGLVTVSPYALPKLPNTIGVIAQGKIGANGKNGTMIVLPLRDKTLKVWTEGTDYATDFSSNVLANFSFSP